DEAYQNAVTALSGTTDRSRNAMMRRLRRDMRDEPSSAVYSVPCLEAPFGSQARRSAVIAVSGFLQGPRKRLRYVTAVADEGAERAREETRTPGSLADGTARSSLGRCARRARDGPHGPASGP